MLLGMDVESLRPNRALYFFLFFVMSVMSYDFDTLYKAYLSDPYVIRAGYTTLQDFHDQVTGSVNNAIDSGIDIDPEALWLMEYMDRALEANPDWYATYELA